jgi:hypothetical protein
MMEKPAFNKRKEDRGKHLADYWPLFVLIFVSALAGHAMNQAGISDIGGFMQYFMGFFLISFSTLKLFNPSGFADGFQMYDLLAKRARLYAYLYPLIELGLGLGYLSFYKPEVIYIATIIVFSFGAAGVLLALRRGLDMYCPCMGTILKVPLSTVTLTEDLTMVAMAAWMLLKL